MPSSHLSESALAGCVQGTFRGSHALRLFYQRWLPVAQAKGAVTLVHGLGEHSGRYDRVVSGLTAAGYAVYAFDNQGHGRSEGQRGHIDHWQDYRENLNAFLQLVRQQQPTLPLFLMGHSLGGLIVLEYALRGGQNEDFRALKLVGLMVSAPPLQPNFEGATRPARVLMARMLSGLFPRLTLKMGICEGGLSRDSAVIEKMAVDPLTHPYVTVRWGTEVLKTIDWVKAHLDQLSLPILLTHGEADPIMAIAGTRDLYQQLKTPHKTLYTYPESYHEPHNDLDADKVVADLVDWLNTSLARQVSCQAEATGA